jgi:hypothetical protein
MRRNAIALLAGLVLAVGACDDDDGVRMGPGGDVNGTWVVQRASGAVYLRVLPSTVEMYVESDTCFLKSEFGIQAVEGVSFTVVPVDGGSSSDWTLERDGDRLTVATGIETLTFEPSTESVGQLTVCGGPEPEFPHPGCSNIQEVEVGSTQTSALGEGSTQWSDDTWYELWSIQLDAPTTVTITMSSPDFDLLDPYLLFYEASGAEDARIDDNDDIDFDAGNYNSRIGPIDLAAGCYIIVAGSWQGDDEGEVGGEYSVSVQ